MNSILFLNARVIDVVNKKIELKDLLVRDARISFPEKGKNTASGEVIDLAGSYVSPGFIDGHIHVESSMLTPVEFAAEAVNSGTTSIFVDPHEIANVLGVKGVKLFLEQADILPLTMFVGAPSCVPATEMETSGGEITLADIKTFLADDRVYGLAEMMNFPGVIHDIGDARKKVKAALDAGKVADGHAPGLSGEDLETYISNGEMDWESRIGSDHECTTAKEAIEKWEKGMYIMLRHGSASKDLENILPGICREGIALDRFGLVSDDLSAADLRRRGHVNHLIGIAARILHKESGRDFERSVIEAIAMATVNHGKYFRKDIGVIAEGARADLVVFDSLEKIVPRLVVSRGAVVSKDGVFTGRVPFFDYSPYAHPVKVNEDLADKFVTSSTNDFETVRVIGVNENSLLTDEIDIKMDVREGSVRPSPGDGVYKLAVLERHKGTGNVFTGFVKGFEFKGGAIASTVAHDSHNLVVLGADEASMIKVVELVKRSGGGLAAVYGEDEAILPLDLAGLMTTRGIEALLASHDRLMELTKKMGFSKDPFPALSFIALPVIPKLKLTDKGLVDVEKFAFTGLFV